MIAANELRVGNWVKIVNDETVGIEIQRVFQIYEGRINNAFGDDIEPIPITPEILLKAGFANDDNLNIRYSFEIFENHELTLGGFEHETERGFRLSCDYCYYDKTLKHIQYVHQLQNLYFALTGEELPIELTENITT